MPDDALDPGLDDPGLGDPGLEDAGLEDAGPVVAGLDGSAESVAAAHEAAVEGTLRGTALQLVSVVPEQVPAPRAAAPVPGRRPPWLDDVAEGVAGLHPGLAVSARVLHGRPVATLRALSRAASLLVLGARGIGAHRLWAAGSVCRPLLGASACPVLVANRGSGGGSALVVVQLEDADRPSPRDVPVLDVGMAQAVRRGADLLVVHPYRHRRDEDDAAALRRARRRTTEAMTAVAGPARRLPGLVVTTVHTTAPPASSLVMHGRGAVLAVLGGAPPEPHLAAALDALPCSVVVVPPSAPDRRESCRAAYRQALLDELAGSPARVDGCSTPEELDDAWRVGTASPAVGDRVVLAWRACLQRAAGRGDDTPEAT